MIFFHTYKKGLLHPPHEKRLELPFADTRLICLKYSENMEITFYFAYKRLPVKFAVSS